MKFIRLTLVGFVLFTVSCSIFPRYRNASEATLNRLIEERKEVEKKAPKDYSTELVREYKVKPEDITKNSDEFLSVQYKELKKIYEQVDIVDEADLTEDDRITYTLFKNNLEDKITLSRFRTHIWEIDHISGPHFPFTPSKIESKKEIQDLIKQYKSYSKAVQTMIHNLRKGISEKKFAPRIAVARTIDHLNEYRASNLKALHSFRELSKELSGAKEYYDKIETIIHHNVKEPLDQLIAFLEEEILTRSREDPGLHSLKGGGALYRVLIRHHTSLNLDPKWVHELGLKELKKNQDQLMEIAAKMGFNGTLQQFFSFIRDNPENYPKDKESYMQYMKDLTKKAYDKMEEYFGNYDGALCEVIEMDPVHAINAPTAYGGKKYWVNTNKLETRPLYTAAALTYHEADPGHHTHYSYHKGKSKIEIPENRKYYFGNSVFTEGWAHYVELLADEMGLYETNLDYVGKYTYQAWRAARLVIDTGIHEFGWSREKAINFLKENVPMAENNIINEIDRYIVWPAQALAYKIGQLEILKLRKKAEEELGEQFDIREFHYQIFKNGPLPLKLLNEIIDKWIAAKKPIVTS